MYVYCTIYIISRLSVLKKGNTVDDLITKMRSIDAALVDSMGREELVKLVENEGLGKASILIGKMMNNDLDLLQEFDIRQADLAGEGEGGGSMHEEETDLVDKLEKDKADSDSMDKDELAEANNLGANEFY